MKVCTARKVTIIDEVLGEIMTALEVDALIDPIVNEGAVDIALEQEDSKQLEECVYSKKNPILLMMF